MIGEGNTLFTIPIEDLKILDPKRAVEFFRRLLWAEAARIGIGKNLINVPECINTGDGGIDAYTENGNPSSEEIIPKGLGGFQIKSADIFPKVCKKELHQNNDLSKPLKPEIERILKEGGTYILVLFADITGEKKNSREKAINEELKKQIVCPILVGKIMRI